MMIFNNFNTQRFTFNGIQYFKNYISKVAGNQISVFNAYDRKDVLVDWVHFGGVEVNGVTFGNVADLQSALLPVIYTRSSLGGGGGGGVESVTGNLVDNTDPDNPIVNGLADVIAGTNITIDKTDPANPIISSSGGGTSQQIPLQVLEVTLSDLEVSTMAEVNPTVVQAYISTLNTPLEVDKVLTVRVVEGGEAPLNEFVWSEGDSPSLEAFETAIGFSLINGQKIGDTITFDNTGYNIPDNAFEFDENLISVLSQAVLLGQECFNGCASCISFTLPECTGILFETFNACELAIEILIPKLTYAATSSFGSCVSVLDFNYPLLSFIDGNYCFANCSGALRVNLPSLEFINAVIDNDGTFSGMSSCVEFNLPLLFQVGNVAFQGCTSAEIFNLNSLDAIGEDTSNNNVFQGISGNTITVTVPISNQTSNGGNLEGDLQTLDDNNTVTFIWV